TSHPAGDERSPLPSGRQSRLPSPTSTLNSSAGGPAAEEQSPMETTGGDPQASSETVTGVPSPPLGAAAPAADHGDRGMDTDTRHDRHGPGAVHHQTTDEAA